MREELDLTRLGHSKGGRCNFDRLAGFVMLVEDIELSQERWILLQLFQPTRQ